jgi:hypothetical protein
MNKESASSLEKIGLLGLFQYAHMWETRLPYLESERPHRRFGVWYALETVVGFARFSCHGLPSQPTLRHKNSRHDPGSDASSDLNV